MPNEETFKPKRQSQVQVHYEHPARGDIYYILHNPDANTYVSLDSQNYFLWELMDGEHTLADLAMEYSTRYDAFPFERLNHLIEQLEANALLEGATSANQPPPAADPAPWLSRLADSTFQREFPWHQADAFFTTFYRSIGWLFFTRAALIAFGAITIIGFICFVILEPTEPFQLFSINKSYGLGLIILYNACWIVLFWHESGHGLACKSFGRRIHRAGLMFYYGMPAFFVDTSDMWMEQRKPRILVSLAGPIVNVIIGCVIAILVILLPISVWTQALFQVAYVTFLGALLNLNPLLEFDGYYILMDWLEMPQLRRRSFAFLRTGLVTKILTRSAFSREERIYFLYSILSLIVTALIILFALYIWKTEVQWMVRSLHAGEDLLAVMCLAVLTIAAGTSFILGFSARAILVSGSAFKRWRTMMIRIRDTREKK